MSKRQASAGSVIGCNGIVVYPQFGNPPTPGDDVERCDQFRFYEIGQSMARLARLEGDVPAHVAVYGIWEAQRLLKNLLEGIPIPIGVSRAKAMEFLQAVNWIDEAHFRQANADGTTSLKFPEPNDPPVPQWRWNYLKGTLGSFETVFREEMHDTATYFVPRRGIYYTPALVDSADETFPKELLPFIPEKAREDWRAAGRCLAFNLLSASGFHTARAVEATLESYYQLFSGKAGETLRSWWDYKEASHSSPSNKNHSGAGPNAIGLP